MWEILASFSVLIEFAIFVAVGYAGRKLKYFDEKTLSGAIELLMKVAVPGVILDAASEMSLEADILGNVGGAAGDILPELRDPPAPQPPFEPRAVLAKTNRVGFIGVSSFKNISFMGLPVCAAVLGGGSTFYVSFCIMAFTLLHWSYGCVPLFGSSQLNLKSILANPAIVSSVVMLLLLVSRISLPDVVWETIHAAGSLCTPLSLIAIGIMLANVKLSTILSSAQMYYTSAFTLLLPPLVTYGLVRLCRPASEVAAVLLVQPRSTRATLNAVMAERYGGDGSFVSLCVLQTMLLSLVTIPLISMVLLQGYL